MSDIQGSDAAVIDSLSEIIDKAKAQGADGVRVVMRQSKNLDVSVRGGKVEGPPSVGQSQALSITVHIGDKAAAIQPASLHPDLVHEAIGTAIQDVKYTTDNPDRRLARQDEYATLYPDLELYDATPLEDRDLINMALEVEDAALSVPRVSQSEGANAGQQYHSTFLLTSEGFQGASHSSMTYFGVGVLASHEEEKQVGSKSNAARYVEDLRDPVEIGREAGENAAEKLGSTGFSANSKIPVIFAPEVASTLLQHFSAAISGHSVSQKQTFLSDYMDRQIFGKGVTIIDDPTIKRGLGSYNFNKDGIAGQRLSMVENGILKHWLLSLQSANKMGLAPQGNSGAANMLMLPGAQSPEELIASVGQGIYVTGVMSQGVDIATGSYSKPVSSGFLIENGERTRPINGIGIAGNLKDMFATLEPANDINDSQTRSRVVIAPTILVPEMTIGD